MGVGGYWGAGFPDTALLGKTLRREGMDNRAAIQLLQAVGLLWARPRGASPAEFDEHPCPDYSLETDAMVSSGIVCFRL